jgi:hypothetical protein
LFAVCCLQFAVCCLLVVVVVVVVVFSGKSCFLSAHYGLWEGSYFF